MSSVIRYPADIDGSSNIPFVTFSFQKVGEFGARTQSDAPTLVLFMPPAFQITDRQEYEFKEQGVLGQIFTNLTRGGGVSDAALQLLDQLKATIFGAQGAAELGQAVRDPKFFNYKEPSPREFTFNYKFEPKNQRDANAMMSIISSFRRASYPDLLTGGKMYGVPDNVTMKFGNVFTGIEDTLTYLAIKEVNTTISEGDQVTTFNLDGSGSNGVPTQVSLQVQLAETALLSKQDGKLGAIQAPGA